MILRLAFGFMILIAFSLAPRSDANETREKKAARPLAQPARTPLKPSRAPAKPARSREQVEAEAIIRNVDLLKFATGRLEHLRGAEIGCFDCFASSAGEDSTTLNAKSAARICKDKWLDFYSKEPVDPKDPDGPKKPIDVRIVFGYQDSDDDNLAGDVLQRQVMVDRITAKCADDNLVQACDFKRCPANSEGIVDADCFQRDIRGPDAKMHKMQVRLIASSFSSSDVINRAFATEQRAKTAQTSRAFSDGLKSADMLLYVGHAREAGGPDFAPAERRPNGTINYDHYRANTPGLDRLTIDLMGTERTPKIMGFFACESERWRDRLSRLAPKSGLILSATPKMPIEVGATQAFAALDSAIWQRCETSFNKAVNLNPKPNEEMIYGETKLIPLSLTNFYK